MWCLICVYLKIILYVPILVEPGVGFQVSGDPTGFVIYNECCFFSPSLFICICLYLFYYYSKLALDDLLTHKQMRQSLAMYS